MRKIKSNRISLLKRIKRIIIRIKIKSKKRAAKDFVSLFSIIGASNVLPTRIAARHHHYKDFRRRFYKAYRLFNKEVQEFRKRCSTYSFFNKETTKFQVTDSVIDYRIRYRDLLKTNSYGDPEVFMAAQLQFISLTISGQFSLGITRIERHPETSGISVEVEREEGSRLHFVQGLDRKIMALLILPKNSLKAHSGDVYKQNDYLMLSLPRDPEFYTTSKIYSLIITALIGDQVLSCRKESYILHRIIFVRIEIMDKWRKFLMGRKYSSLAERGWEILQFLGIPWKG